MLAYSSRSIAWFVFAVCVVATTLGSQTAARAEDPSPIVQADEKKEGKVTGKAEKELKPKNVGTGNACVAYDFHPPQPSPIRDEKGNLLWEKHPFSFNPAQEGADGVKRRVFTPPTIPTQYAGNEEHKTTGGATFGLSMPTTAGGPLVIKANISAWINPGDKGTKVSVFAALQDPFSFSDSDPTSVYYGMPDGIDYSFSLMAGTHFANDLAEDITPLNTMSFRARVTPGVIRETDEFWVDGVPGAVELYALNLTIDANRHVNADLAFGASSADFTLDFRDAAGQPFDPTDPAKIAMIGHAITQGFSNGAISSDLSNLFTVGIVPANADTGFTFGASDQLAVGGYEPPVPEPSALLSLGSGLLVLWGVSRRKS